MNSERSEICQGDGMGRYRFRKGGTSPRTLTARFTSSITIHEKQRGSIRVTGESNVISIFEFFLFPPALKQLMSSV